MSKILSKTRVNRKSRDEMITKWQIIFWRKQDEETINVLFKMWCSLLKSFHNLINWYVQNLIINCQIHQIIKNSSLFSREVIQTSCFARILFPWNFYELRATYLQCFNKYDWIICISANFSLFSNISDAGRYLIRALCS